MAIAEESPLPIDEYDDLDEPIAAPLPPELESESEPGSDAVPTAEPEVPISGPGRVLLASLSVAAGVIHLVMVPSHAGVWLPEGIAFAAAGWFQIGMAVLLVNRPSRAVLQVSCLANVVFIGAWTISRISGVPFGPEAGVPHAASFIDVTCVVFELVLVTVGYELLVRPELGERLSNQARVVLSVIPLGILVLATAAIASPSALNHAHGSGETATTALVSVSSSGHDHNAAATAAPAVDDVDGVDDKGLSQIMNGKGEGGGHAHNATVVAVDAGTQLQLDAQLAQTRAFIEKYPTVKDAEAVGYHREGPYVPGLGAHYMAAGAPKVGTSMTMTDESLAHPFLIYDGVAPDSKLAGFMYQIFSLDTQNPPEGFVGPNDHWHYHINVCIVARSDGGIDAPLGADTSATQEVCDRYGGRLVANTGYMVHTWTVPGYESSQGLFSNVNPRLTCPDGTYYVVPPEDYGTRTNVCRDVQA